jgi:hypothetical protein
MSHNYNKIIFNLMIKNESKIIERCISRALEHVDAISILDTGSTDNTVEICNDFLKKCGKPFKISVEPFKNFGFNRTVSFEKTVELCNELGWNADKTYAMAVDADMIIKPSNEFKNFKMELPGYTVIQQNGTLKYYNCRFMRCSYNWKCIGATHEYWGGDPTNKIPYEIFYIDDINDGGCKADKFERDIRLLTEDLVKDPDNTRTYFYLAQSYKDSGQFEKAIANYRKRIELGGWYEEVWQAHYQIAKCYECLKLPEEMELWALKAFKYHPRRAEPLYLLTTYFKNSYEHFKAYQYYLKGRDIPFPKDDVLFVEYSLYDGLFDYENTILSCYVFNKSKQDSLNDLVSYINNKKYHIDNVFDNLQYYVEPLAGQTYKGNYTPLSFRKINEFEVSSCCVTKFDDKLILNTRLVNYSIDGRGSYHIRSDDGNVKTKNGITFLDDKYRAIEDIILMEEKPDKTYPSNIEGLEDVRLFTFKNRLFFTASTKNLSNDGKIHIALGEYNYRDKVMENIALIAPPELSDCEKNWIYIPENTLGTAKNKMNFIYNWYPLKIGAIDANKQLNIHTTIETPRFFQRFRGSSTICEYDGRLWCVAHLVRYSTPRVYLHSVVVFNRETMLVEMYSLPFCFRKTAIEYCLGLHIKDGQMCFIFSQNDSEPGIITIPITNLKFLTIN